MRRYLLPLVIVGVFLAPAVASAVSWFPIVPCGVGSAPACTPCDLFKTFKNIIDLVLYGITGPIAAFMIVWAGGLMLLGGANAKLYTQGKTMLWNTLIGVAIILLSWLATNTLIKTLAVGNTYDAWFEFSCPAYLQQPGEVPLPTPVQEQGNAEKPASILQQAAVTTCDPANLAKAYGVPNNTKLDSNSLTALIACVEGDTVVRAMLDMNQVFTYDHDHPLCNLKRGDPRICGSCSHGINSCHYGGRTGNQGAMAVDFNWNGKTVTYVKKTRAIVTNLQAAYAAGGECAPTQTDAEPCRKVSGEPGLFDEVYRSAKNNRCDYKFINYEPQGSGHTHMSTTDCTSDGVGTGGRSAPITP